MVDLEKVFYSMRDAVLKADHEIMKYYTTQMYDVVKKKDGSPVTNADLSSNHVIRKTLVQDEAISYLSEEEKDDISRLKNDYVYIVDPLDGTEDFLACDDSFSVNIALVKNGVPLIAFIGLPTMDAYCYAIKNRGAFFVKDGKEERLHVSDKKENLTIVMSMTHTLKEEEDIILKHKDKITNIIKAGASVKAYLIASGKADVSIRYTDKTKEWDTCACDLLVKESGGIFVDTRLKTFTYNRRDVRNHKGYCMFNREENFSLLK